MIGNYEELEKRISVLFAQKTDLKSELARVRAENSRYTEYNGNLTAKMVKQDRQFSKLKRQVEDFIRNVTADQDAELNGGEVPTILESIEKGMSEYRDSAAKAERERAAHVDSLNSLIQLWNVCHSRRSEQWTPETFFDHARVTLKRSLSVIENGVDADAQDRPLETYGRTDHLHNDIAALEARVREVEGERDIERECRLKNTAELHRADKMAGELRFRLAAARAEVAELVGGLRKASDDCRLIKTAMETADHEVNIWINSYETVYDRVCGIEERAAALVARHGQ